MATLSYVHFGNPGRGGPQAHYSKKVRLFFLLKPYGQCRRNILYYVTIVRLRASSIGRTPRRLVAAH